MQFNTLVLIYSWNIHMYEHQYQEHPAMHDLLLAIGYYWQEHMLLVLVRVNVVKVRNSV